MLNHDRTSLRAYCYNFVFVIALFYANGHSYLSFIQSLQEILTSGSALCFIMAIKLILTSTLPPVQTCNVFPKFLCFPLLNVDQQKFTSLDKNCPKIADM